MMADKDVEVSEAIMSPSPVTVHGVVVGEVSPVKTSKTKSGVKYFDGTFTDGKKALRMISFDPKLRDQFEEAHKNKYPVALKNCFVKRGRTDELEILVNTKSSVMKSPKKFKISEDDIGVLQLSQCPVLGTLEEVKDIAENQHITINGKIISLSASEQVVAKSTGRKFSKQDFTIADCTAAIRGVAWEDHFNALKEDSSYKIVSATVRSFNGAKYVSLGEKSTVEELSDIGDVVGEELVYHGAGDVTVLKADIVAVMSIESYISCRVCDGKVIQINEMVGKCGKCNTKIKMAKCGSKSVGRIVIEDDEGKEYKLTIFNNIIEQICEIAKGEIKGDKSSIDVSELLLSAPQLIYTFTSKEVVSSVAKMQ